MDPSKLFEQGGASVLPSRVLSAGLVAAFSLAFLAVSQGIHWARAAAGQKPPHIEMLSPKLEHVAAEADRYDVVFLGASHVYRHVVPSVVDEVLAETGHKVRSLNLGVASLSVLEAEKLVDALEEARPEGLRLVVVDPLFARLDVRNWATHRAIVLHDAAGTRHAILFTRDSEITSPRQAIRELRQMGVHLLSFLCNRVNLGQLTRSLFPSPHRFQTPSFATPDFDQGGYLALEAEPNERFTLRHEKYLEQRPIYEERMRRERPRAESNRMSEYQIRVLRQMVERVRGMGATPVLLNSAMVDPVVAVDAFLRSYAEHFSDVVLLDYSYGHGFEEVYRPELWFDGGHLTREGAEIFSRRLAQDLIPLLPTNGDARSAGR